MFIVKTQIVIIQTPSKAFPTRTNKFDLDFVVEYEVDNSWEDLTDEGKITLPKKFKYISTTGNDVHPANVIGVGSNIGGFSEPPPLFLRGDQVTLIAGYKFKLNGQDITDTATLFQGYISRVTSKKPFTLEVEDNMYILKQTPAVGGVNGVFSHTKYTVEAMLAELIKNAGLPFTVNAITSTDLGLDFRINNNSISQVLERLRREVFLKSYFRGNELRTGSQVYIESEANTYNFGFQKNIISDKLEYERKDDLVLSAIATSENTIATGETTKDGYPKTKTVKLQVLITWQNGNFTSIIKQPGDSKDFPTNNSGERHDLPYTNIPDPQVLIFRAALDLSRYYYTGFRGSFETFGIPFVRFGDNVDLIDDILPERNGLYKVKKVEYKFSVDGGMRQTVHLDYLINLS